MRRRILIVEDDPRLAGLVQRFLEKHEFEVTTERRGDRAVERVLSLKPDLVILDLNLPGRDGLEVCRDLQRRYHGAIVMLTARDEELDEVEGLESGADDYIVKPVRPQVLLARVRTLLRRIDRSEQEPARVFVGELALDKGRRTVTRANRTIELTSAEFDLLWLLSVKAGTVVSREAIYRALRGIDYDGVDRSVDLRVSKIRKKLGDNPKQPQLIKSVRGVGYIVIGAAS